MLAAHAGQTSRVFEDPGEEAVFALLIGMVREEGGAGRSRGRNRSRERNGDISRVCRGQRAQHAVRVLSGNAPPGSS